MKRPKRVIHTAVGFTRKTLLNKSDLNWVRSLLILIKKSIKYFLSGSK